MKDPMALVACVALTLCCCGPSRTVMIQDHGSAQSFHPLAKEVEWRTDSVRVRYTVELTLRVDRTAELALSLTNMGSEPIFLLLNQPVYAVLREGRKVFVVVGNHYFNYGNELPVLERVEPLETVEHFAVVELPVALREINFIEVGFYGIFEDAVAVADRFESLEEVSGWWQTSDWKLADDFLSRLVYQATTFPLVPVKEGPITGDSP